MQKRLGSSLQKFIVKRHLNYINISENDRCSYKPASPVVVARGAPPLVDEGAPCSTHSYFDCSVSLAVLSLTSRPTTAVLSFRLWHQLTVKLLAIIKHDSFSDDGLVDVSWHPPFLLFCRLYYVTFGWCAVSGPYLILPLWTSFHSSLFFSILLYSFTVTSSRILLIG